MALRGYGAMSSFEQEIVYTVNDYWDGPRVGVANFKGEPYYYECIFDESSDEWSTRFWLHALDPETVQLVMEDWKIWERWRVAFHQGKTDQESHPCLPDD